MLTQTFLGVRHAFLPHERLLTWAEKNVDQSQQTSRSGKYTLDLEKFRAWLFSSRKDQKGLIKGEDLTVLKQTTQLTHKGSYWWLPSQSRKKLPRRLNLLNGSRLYYKIITCEKNPAFCSVLQSIPAVASPKERLYEQTTSNPAFTERNIQKANAYLLYSRQEQKSLVTYHTLQSLYVCVWLVNTLTSTAPIGSPIICMWSPADICEQWERNLSLSSADVHGAGTCDEPLRTSAWEARVMWKRPV